jgi:hypothetical protein
MSLCKAVHGEQDQRLCFIESQLHQVSAVGINAQYDTKLVIVDLD